MAIDKAFPEGRDCDVERTLAVIGPKWTTLILRDLIAGTKRFGELRRSFPGISPKTLTQRLRDLEDQGLLSRTIYSEIPPRVEYALTPRGQTLDAIIAAMAAWGAQDRAYGDTPPAAPVIAATIPPAGREANGDLRQTPRTSIMMRPPHRRSVSVAGRRSPSGGGDR